MNIAENIFLSMRRLIVIILFVAGVSYLVELYAFQGFRLALLGINAPIYTLLVYAYWVIAFGTTILLGARMFFVGIPPGKSRLTEFLFSFFISVFISSLVFDLVLFIEDVYRVVAMMVSQTPEHNLWISRIGLLLSAFTFASFLYGITRGKHSYKVHKHTLFFDDLPDVFDGFKIVQISDIHSGSFNDEKAVQRGIDLVNEQKADLFVFTGDLVNNLAAEIEPWINHF